MEKLTVVVASILCILIFAAAIVCVNIWNLKSELDYLYWVAENTHSGMVGWAIEHGESMLRQKLMELTLLVGVTTTLVIVVVSFRSIRHKHSPKRRAEREQEMKISRFKVTVLVLLAVTVIYPVALYLDIQGNEAWKRSYLESHPDVAPWIDFAPYTSTFTGGLLTIIGIVLAGSWLMTAIHRKKLKSAMLMVLMFLVVLAFTPRAYAGYYEKTVDVLAVQDEEFRFLYPEGWQRDLGWGIYIDIAFGRFEKEFGMTFKLRGWIDWDSTDYSGDLYDLLDDAITETNFESHVTTYNGYKIDILMVFTGEPVEGLGFSPPEWKALIIYALPDAPRGRLVQHELTHQFSFYHCGNDCIMNPAKWETGQWVPDYWCGQCTTTINDNNDRFWRWVEGGGGGCCPVLSVYDGEEYVEEGLLDIHNEEEEDTVVNHQLNTTPAKVNNKYHLRLTEPDLSSLNLTSHSFIDQIKLLATYGGETTECVLVGAEHSEAGNVLYELLLSDDVRTDTEPDEYIDLAFITPTGEIEYFTFVIEGYNHKYFDMPGVP